jgi:hypothetical protein
VRARVPDAASERSLEELRAQAMREGSVAREGVRPVGAPFPVATPETGYYGVPVLKEPTWTWEVPLYFFVGGAAGAAAVVAGAAQWTGADPGLVRAARWVAAAGAAASPPLLIADLGRPERFLNMLRVFKPQSPMSVGSWTLVAFSTAAAASAFADEIDRRANGAVPVRLLRDAAGTLAAATGLVMSTYTGVLVGATAIPAWSENAELLPAHFGASALASAVSILELLGRRDEGLNALGIGAALAETAAGAAIERRHRRSLEPLKQGPSGWMVRAGGVLSGPVALALRLIAARNPALRRAAALSAIAGSLLTRFGWVAAGHVSARDPIPALTPQAENTGGDDA